MNEIVMLSLFIGLLVFFFISGIPVAFGLGLTSLVLMLLGVGPGVNPDIIISRMFRGLDSFVLLCVPLFIMGARIMNEAGLTTRLFGFAKSARGAIQGGTGACLRDREHDHGGHERRLPRPTPLAWVPSASKL